MRFLTALSYGILAGGITVAIVEEIERVAIRRKIKRMTRDKIEIMLDH